MDIGIFRRELWTKELFSWYLYDFANSLFVVNASLYFSQWIVVDNKLPDLWFGLPFIVGTAFLIFLSPYFGELGDRNNSHSKIFILSTAGAIISSFLIFAGGRIIITPIWAITVTLIFYGSFNLLYQLALVPYSSFLKQISSPEIYGKVSGLGFAFNQLGYVAGILMTLPIINHSFKLFGNDRLAPLFPAALFFSICTLPGLFFLKSKRGHCFGPKEKIPFWATFWANLNQSRNYPAVFRFLISFYLFSDALLSLSLYAAIFLQNVFNISDSAKAMVFLFVVIAQSLGSFLGGIISDRAGHRKTLIVFLVITVFSIIPLALTKNADSVLYIFSIFGFATGVVYASSRAYFASLVPDGQNGRFFGLYTFSERAASVFGPIIWGIIVWSLASFFPWNYRIAALAMALIVALGIIPLVFGRKNKNT